MAAAHEHHVTLVTGGHVWTDVGEGGVYGQVRKAEEDVQLAQDGGHALKDLRKGGKDLVKTWLSLD